MASRLHVGPPNNQSMIGEASRSGVTSESLNTTIEFLSAQKQLYDVLHLLQSTYEMFDKHQCDSRRFEIAFWQENDKLVKAVQVNKALAQQIDELRRERNHEGWHEDSLKPRAEVFEEGNGSEMQSDEYSSVTLKLDGGGVEEPQIQQWQQRGDRSLQKEHRQRNRDKLRGLARAFLFGSK
ncbi:hypothetical protein ACJZ2D_017218 [Fusarium nematophilum]